jgi:hypothetical protein
MAKKSQCEQCDKYNAERGLCRKDWSLVVFDDTECGLLAKENGQSNTEKAMTPSNVQEQKDSQPWFENNRRQNLRESVITVSGAGIAHMQSIAKWTKFLAIVSAIEIALMALLSIGMLAHGGKIAFLSIIYIMMIAILCYPVKKAFDLANHMKNSAFRTNGEELENGLGDLRSILRYMGVLTIIMLIPYALTMLLLVLGGTGAIIAALFQ